MKENIIAITSSDLKEGMILAKDIKQDGRILLKKDLKVTKAIINRLTDLLFVDNIYVYDDGTSDRELTLKEKEAEEFCKIEKEFKDISLKLEDTFKGLKDSNHEVVNEIEEFSNKIRNELNPSSIIVKNIVLHGSGKDCIYRHGVNVSALSGLIGKWIGLNDEDLNSLIFSAIIHDIGKAKINNEILNKKTNLTEDEYNIIKNHPVWGYDMIKDIQAIDQKVSYGVLMHHEREDASGYPLGIKGDSIHPFGKIIAIADVFDAINSNREYKNKRAPFEALQIIKNESLGKLDYTYVKVFLEHIINYYLGEEVILNNGERCKIIQMNINNLEKPLVLKDMEFIDLDKHDELYIKELLL